MPNYQQMAADAARKYGINERYFVNQIRAESGFDPKAGSPAGAQGIAQFMPDTARGMGVDPWDPRSALDGSARLMSRYVNKYGNYRDALTAYNAGPGRVGKPLYAETAAYHKKVLGGGGGVQEAGGVREATGGDRASTSSPPGLGFDVDEWFLGDDPDLLALVRQRKAAEPEPEPEPIEQHHAGDGHGHDYSQGVMGVESGKFKGKDWRWLQRMGQQKFGLRNDAGDSQTIGGRHSAGSEHYSGRAIDFGDAKNSRAQLNKWMDWARRQGLDVLWEGDHAHVSFPGSGI